MYLNRREFIISSASVGIGSMTGVAALAKKPGATEKIAASQTPEAVFSILNRISYGATPATEEALTRMGLKAYLHYQLNPAPEPALQERLEKATLHIEYKAKEIKSLKPGEKPPEKPEETYPALKEDRHLLALSKPIEELWKLSDGKKFPYSEQVRPTQEVRSATWLRAVYSEWQLREVMVEFWHNHFNVNAFGEGKIGAIFPLHDRIIRENCFGNFRSLLEEIAKSTAMLFYLNNAKSKASPANENYARELFELHTLGANHYYNNLYNRWREVPGAVKGKPIGYIDQDVYEAARAFTGWTVEDGTNTGKGTTFASTGKFIYFDGWHDNYQKRVLGVEFDPNTPPMQDGKKVLDLLTAHEGTAINLSTKLCQRFISDNPSDILVKKIAKVWQLYANHPEQIKQVLEAIILSPEFAQAQNQKVKRPLEFVASFLRMTGAEFMPTEALFNAVMEAGYKQFAWPTPTGHPDIAEYWLNSNTTLSCWNIISDLLTGGIKGASFDLAAQTPENVKTSGQIIYYWVKRLTGREVDNELFYALLQYTPNPIDYNFVPDWHNNDVKTGLNQMIATIAMLPDFRVR